MWIEVRHGQYENEGLYEVVLHMTELPVIIGTFAESLLEPGRWVALQPGDFKPLNNFVEMAEAIIEYRMGGDIFEYCPVHYPRDMDE